MIRRCSPAAFIVQSAFIAHFFLLIEPKLIDKLVEAAGIEPASVNPPRTGDYMLSLSLI